MSKKPRILLTNDDGIDAAGIRFLWEALKDHADCTIVTPATERSGSGLAITIHEPVRVLEVPWPEDTPAWKVTGTPVDAVKLALGVILDEAPDLIVSGINNGSNAGRNLFYSGTVGTVIEGAIRGIPGVAFSCVDKSEPPFKTVMPHIPRIVNYVMEHPMEVGTILNINFPSKSAGPLRGIRMAKQGNGYWTDAPMERVDHNDLPYYWLGGKNIMHQEDEDADVALLEQGFAAVVPVRVGEMTDHQMIETKREHFESIISVLQTDL